VDFEKPFYAILNANKSEIHQTTIYTKMSNDNGAQTFQPLRAGHPFRVYKYGGTPAIY
jgi:hypothetical protein